MMVQGMGESVCAWIESVIGVLEERDSVRLLREEAMGRLTLGSSFACIVADVESGIVSRFLEAVVEATVYEVFVTSSNSYLEQSNGYKGLGLLSRYKAVGVNENIIGRGSGGWKGLGFIATGCIVDDQFDIGKGSETLCPRRDCAPSESEDTILSCGRQIFDDSSSSSTSAASDEDGLHGRGEWNSAVFPNLMTFEVLGSCCRNQSISHAL